MTILVAKLNNGVMMPAVGLGTYETPRDKLPAAIEAALQNGYRAIDTAWFYENEDIIGPAIEKFGNQKIKSKENVVRTELFETVSDDEFFDNFSVPHGKLKDDRRVFITTKIWPTHFTEEQATADVELHLKRFNRETSDLCLLHWPGVPEYGNFDRAELDALKKKFNNPECRIRMWKLMEEFYHQKKFRAIGLSNYSLKFLKPLVDDILKRKAAGCSKATLPMVNQIEINPALTVRQDFLDFSRQHRIHITAYAPLGAPGNRHKLCDLPRIAEIAKRHNKSSGVVVLRWALDRNYLIIPRSSQAAHIIENYDLMDFNLTKEDLEEIKKYESSANRYYPDPDTVEQ